MKIHSRLGSRRSVRAIPLQVSAGILTVAAAAELQATAPRTLQASSQNDELLASRGLAISHREPVLCFNASIAIPRTISAGLQDCWLSPSGLEVECNMPPGGGKDLFRTLLVSGMTTFSQDWGCHIPRTPIDAALSSSTACDPLRISFLPPRIVAIEPIASSCAQVLVANPSLSLESSPIATQCPFSISGLQHLSISDESMDALMRA